MIGSATKLCLAAAVATITLHAAWSATAFNFARTDAGPVPDLVFQDADGKEHSLEEYRGRVVVLNLWATWCAPCREEMPSLDRLQAKHGGDDLQVIALSVDRGGIEQIVEFYDEVGVANLAIFRDPQAKTTRRLRAPGLPTTLVIDRQGNEVGRVLGDAEWDGAEVLSLLEALMAE